MPDPFKLQALREAGLRIPLTCSRCVHWRPGTVMRGTNDRPSAWGNCKRIIFQHSKHTNPLEAGTPYDATCPNAETSPELLAELSEAHLEFIDGQA